MWASQDVFAHLEELFAPGAMLFTLHVFSVAWRASLLDTPVPKANTQSHV